MSTHCNSGDEPTIYYKFKGESAYRRVQIGVAPIEVIVEPVLDFRETTIVLRKPEHGTFTIPRDSTRKKLVLKPLPWKEPTQDIHGTATSYINDVPGWFTVKKSYRINNVNYTTQVGTDVVIQDSFAQDKYFVSITSFSNKYDFDFTYQEYF